MISNKEEAKAIILQELMDLLAEEGKVAAIPKKMIDKTVERALPSMTIMSERIANRLFD